MKRKRYTPEFKSQIVLSMLEDEIDALAKSIDCCKQQKTTDEIIPRNKRLRAFYDKKCEEGKPYKVALIAYANKLLHWIYALLINKTTFQDLA